MRIRDLHGPVAASAFAGLLGAGLADGLITLVRADGPVPLVPLALVAIGLYGFAGLLVGLGLGALWGAAAGALPGGWAALRAQPELDRRVTAGILAALAGLGVIAIVAALGHQILVGKMQSQKLAAIASAGLVLLAAPPGAAVALGAYAPARALAARVPRPGRLGSTGLLLLMLLGGGVLAGIFALSRADWRVLDLGPLGALAIAAVLGVGHGIFWSGSARGAALARRISPPAAKIAALAGVLIALALGARVPESSVIWKAIADGSLGLRLGAALARGFTDHDGDGFSARWGGGDCDDARADVYPGAEDLPGDGVDQNCEGGDAVAAAEPASEAEPPPVLPALAPAKDPSPARTRAGTAAGSGAGSFKGNILIVTIDAFRADRLGVAGYGRPPGRSLTPALDALARRGAYFRRAWSQAPNTPRSFPSILTSRYPSDIAWDKPGVNYPNLLPSNVTFFEGLAAAGWKNLGIFSHFYFTPDRGISKAFAEWSDDGAGTIAESNKDVASPRIVPRVIDRLRKAAAHKERFVLWTHLFEPHSSYVPHKEFPPRLSGVPGLMEKYDYEIAYVDLWLKKLFAALGELGLADDTAIVVMADHGEAWGEHKVYFHGQDLFDEQLRVPLIIAIPGQPPRAFDDQVSLVDVGPTLLDLVGAPVPAGMRGRSLLPRIRGEERPARPIFSELLPATAWPHHAAMMVDGKHKIIHRISDRRYELYDLSADPAEKKNLADAPAARATFEALRAKVVAFEERKR
ncbi:MAG TPA: sulfatase-like hydrolase/transferase [Polyangia bacterium]|nr:sulfatase-like hydrolase/transferase [Polyangia bacterium]